LPEIIELVNDIELCVSIVALEGLLEVLRHVDAETKEKEIMPNALKLIAKDNRVQEITVRMAAIIGKIVWKLSKSDMRRKYQNEFVTTSRAKTIVTTLHATYCSFIYAPTHRLPGLMMMTKRATAVTSN
jgi:hypothetical protein